MSQKSKDTIMFLSVTIGVLYVLCAFSQYTPDVEHWSNLCRAIFGVGTLIFIIWVIIVRETQY